MPTKNATKNGQLRRSPPRTNALKNLEPIEKDLKSLNSKPYAASPILQAVSNIIEIIKAGEAIHFPQSGEIAVGTVDINELDPADRKCVICWKKMKNYERKTEWRNEHCIVVAKCGHAFGGKCWLKWMRKLGAREIVPFMCHQISRPSRLPTECLERSQFLVNSSQEHSEDREDDEFSVSDPLLGGRPASVALDIWTFRGLPSQNFWRLHHVLAINIFLQSANELGSKDQAVRIYIERAKSIIEYLWLRNGTRLNRPKDLSFVLQNSPMPEHCFMLAFSQEQRGSFGLRFDQLYYTEAEDDNDDDDEDSDQEEPDVEEEVKWKEKSAADKKPAKHSLHDWRVTTLLFNLFVGFLYFSYLTALYTQMFLESGRWKRAILNRASAN
ncbi:uncharacterized protein PAC_07838 [Phialocephala subalpina]|uniref:RING-type domain-containing protein n=1 Tax=Phialocephala subalpina TaxID=576137 RepID=A0A1L7WYU2_9HELO|nr:uncharacterized protein PAC_07838 [Phialocephala subalpina]